MRGDVALRKGRYKMKIFVTEYSDCRKCVAIGEREESALILTEDISDEGFYHAEGDVPEDVSILDPFGATDLSGMRGFLEPAGGATDLYDEDGDHAKGVYVRCPLDTGVYELRADGSIVPLDD